MIRFTQNILPKKQCAGQLNLNFKIISVNGLRKNKIVAVPYFNNITIITFKL